MQPTMWAVCRHHCLTKGENVYQIQYGKGKSAYKVRCSFDSLSVATRWYGMLNTHSGYKKRLVQVETGNVIARYISQ